MHSTRKQETIEMVEDYIVRGIEGILDLAIPDDKEAMKTAGELGSSISALIESLLSEESTIVSGGSQSSSSLRKRGGGRGANIRNIRAQVQNSRNSNSKCHGLISSWITQQRQSASKTKSTKPVSATDTNTLNTSFKQFRQWVVEGSEAGKESGLYEPISQFFCFVSGCIKSVYTQQSSRTSLAEEAHPQRLIVPFSKPDRKSADGDDDSRVDIYLNQVPVAQYTIGTLATNPGSAERQGPMLKDAFALVEVKTGGQGVYSALPQLFRYTRGIYAEQHHRRFAWGIAVGGKYVQIVFFGPNYALASPSINISQKEGRAQLVMLLVNWSFCESHRLGYDSDIVCHTKPDYYEITVDQDGSPTTYYSRSAVVSAERLFGRHTRCFVASTDKPMPGSVFKPDIFIKDAWPEAAEDAAVDHRDESRHLQRIKEAFCGDNSFNGKYPEHHGGGRVKIERRFGGRGDGGMVEDTSISILSTSICEQLDRHTQKKRPPLRVHKRICTKGIGKPLKFANSGLEIICILADAMECHWEIYQRCGILHRDISTNNILFSGSGSRVKGMLIDFDHAICKKDKDMVRNFERTGTLPFMSINNLEGGKIEHSLLDDWESLVYIICWIGTYGWRRQDNTAKEPDIPERRIVSKRTESGGGKSQQS
ncbi:hypothetical protein H4217_008672, partial [Coemansia sp. RSA 1939]